MSITDQELNDFRAQVSAWMRDNKPADPGFLLPQTFMEVGTSASWTSLREWQHKVWSAGYLAHGLAEGVWRRRPAGGVPGHRRPGEMRRHAVPICFNVIGLGWAGPLILDIGSEEEKRGISAGILSAEDIWCQGFSEPDHGSDRQRPDQGQCAMATSMSSTARRSGPPWAILRNT